MTAPARISWVDALKGAAIVLVVLAHTLTMLATVDLSSGPWRKANGLLQTVRMPLFFTAAGLFATKWMAVPWRQLIGRKLVVYWWLYALWTLLLFAVMVLLPLPTRTFGVLSTVEDLLWQPVAPGTALWFLYALALYFVLLRATRRLPVAVVIGALALLSVVLTEVVVPHVDGVVNERTLLWLSIGTYAVFFLAGARARELIFRVSSAVRLWHLALVLPALLLLAPPIGDRLGTSELPGAELVASTLALVCGTAVAVAAAPMLLGRGCGYLGRVTLPIYLLHIPLLLVWAAALEHVSTSSSAIRLALPAIVCAVTVATALGVHRVTRALRWLYDRPGSL